MQLLSLQLVAKRGSFAAFQSRRGKPNFVELEQEVMARDNNSCRYCGFRCDKHQVVVNRNQNYNSKHNVIDNMVTACVFCAQCFLLDGLTTDGNSGGWIIYLPEINQADLNNFCKTLFTSLLSNSAYKGKLQTTYLSLQDRAQVVEEIFGADSSNPFVFAQGVIDTGIGSAQFKHPLMQKLRLLPDRKFFTEEIQYWKSTVFNDIPL